MGPGADGVEKRLAVSLDDIIKKSKDKGSAGKPSAGRAGPGQAQRGRGRTASAAGGRGNAMAVSRANQDRASALRQGKLAEKRGLPPSGAARPAAKALPVSVPRAAARGGRTAGRGAGRGAHGAGQNVGAAARGVGGARAREVGRGGGQGGAVIMPTSMRITIFNELADRRPPAVPPHVADQQRLEQQWAAETLRPSALYEPAAARPARVAPYPAPAAGAAYAAPAAAAARDGGEYGGGYGDARGGGYGDARGGGGRGDWEAAYAGNGYAGGGGRAGPRSSGGGGGYAAAARGGDPNLVMEMEADDAAQGYQEEEGRYGGVLAPVKAARTTPVPRPAAALSPAPQRAPPPAAPAPSYGATLRMDTEPPARTTRHGLLIR